MTAVESNVTSFDAAMPALPGMAAFFTDSLRNSPGYCVHTR
ncbi:hypothetical protein AB7849_17930 [Rhodanobacter sp. 115]|jgi:hypothetical protein|nr:hypothetical protein [Rhodanobacter sp. 115]